MTDAADILDDSDSLRARFSRWDAALDAKWGPWRTETRTCFDFVAGHQWEPDVVSEMEGDNRVAVTFNRVETTIDAVSGAEITGRQQVTYLPRESGDTGPNEVLTQGAEWIRSQCDAEDEESDASRDTLICGMGWTETRVSHDEEPDGQVVIERVDPLEMSVDPSASKANCADARYLRRDRVMSREEFDDLFPGEEPEGFGPDSGGISHRRSGEDAYQEDDGPQDDNNEDEVRVREYQWFDTEVFHRIVDPRSGEEIELSEGEYAQAEEDGLLEQGRALAAALQRPFVDVRQKRRVYKRAFVAGGRLLPNEEGEAVEVLAVGDFTYKAMTGKRDRNRGTWYGLVRPMIDPQRFANKFFSQILHIVDTNAKGGVMMEEGAVESQVDFENSWSDTAAITLVPAGTLSNPGGAKIQPKPMPQYPQAIDRLMDVAVSAIRDVTGVNMEMLGMADRQQPGVLEHQRKQAAYGILSAFFNSFRRYRKGQGRLLIKTIREHLPEDMLVRIVENGQQRFVPLALSSDTARFDIIVDEAPASPMMRERIWATVVQLMPWLEKGDMPPDFWAEVARNSPLPAKLQEAAAKAFMQRAQGGAPEAAAPDPLEQAERVATVAERQAGAALKQAQAAQHGAEAQQIQAGTAAGVVT